MQGHLRQHLKNQPVQTNIYMWGNTPAAEGILVHGTQVKTQTAWSLTMRLDILQQPGYESFPSNNTTAGLPTEEQLCHTHTKL